MLGPIARHIIEKVLYYFLDIKFFWSMKNEVYDPPYPPPLN